jgi:hypothetical protein
MPRRPALFTKADVRRAIRAAKEEGAVEIEIKLDAKSAILIRLVPSPSSTVDLPQPDEIVL